MRDISLRKFAVCCLLLSVCCLLNSCGKKTPPTLKSYEKPDAPVGLKTIHREDSIILFWSHNKKEILKGFHILRSEDSIFQKIAFISKDENYPYSIPLPQGEGARGRDKYAHIDTDFKIGILYKYKVVAQSMKNVLSNDSNVIAVKPELVPSAPKNISFRVGNNDLSISWEGTVKGIFYNIYKSYEKGKYEINPLNTETLKTTSYTDSLELNKPVYYTIRGVLNNESRDEGPASDEIEINPLNFIPSRPSGIQAVVAGDKVILSWKENPESWVMKYRIYRKITDKDEFKPIGESITPTFTDMEKTGRKHAYTVTAVGPAKESEFSKTIIVDF